MKSYTWIDRRSRPAGSNWLKLGVISSERIPPFRGCEEVPGRRHSDESGDSAEMNVEKGSKMAFPRLSEETWGPTEYE